MAEKKEEMKVDKVTGEVAEEKKSDNKREENFVSDENNFEKREFSDAEYNEFAMDESDDEEDGASHSNGNIVKQVFNVPLYVKRSTTGNKRPDGSDYYNYKVGYGYNSTNGKRRSIEIDLEPSARRTTLYDTLDDIYGTEKQRPLEIVKTKNTQRVGSKSVVNESYTFRVSGVDEDGAPISCNLKPVAGLNDLKDNLIAKLKFKGYLT